MALDPRVRQTLIDFQAGHCDLETAATRLLELRRDRGRLELHSAPDSSAAQQALVARFSEMVRQEFGT